MKKILVTLMMSALMALSAHADNDYIQTKMDNNRYEMIQLAYGVFAYNIKFDKWTGNIWLYTKDGASETTRDATDEQDLRNQKCVYQLTKGNKDSVEHCFVVNTSTGEVWEVIFSKGNSIKYEKK